jgi:hypothetical protein
MSAIHATVTVHGDSTPGSIPDSAQGTDQP